MRLWAQQILPYIDRQRLLSQHRECAALRGAGWGRPHTTVNYVFTHNPALLVAYHFVVMDEMEKRGYHPDPIWRDPDYRGKTLGAQEGWVDKNALEDCYVLAYHTGEEIFPEHNQQYLTTCLNLLEEKGNPIKWNKEELNES